jgi:hypothetical protein
MRGLNLFYRREQLMDRGTPGHEPLRPGHSECFRGKVEQGNTQKHGKSLKEVEKCNLTPFDIQQMYQSDGKTFTKPLYQRMLEDLRVEPQ